MFIKYIENSSRFLKMSVINIFLLLEYPGRNLCVSIVGVEMETDWETTLQALFVGLVIPVYF